MTREQKALHLCCEYDRLMERINDMTKNISIALYGCSLSSKCDVDSKGRTVTHLTEAYAPYFDNQGEPWMTRMFLDEDEQLEIFSGCSSCGIAHSLIQKRKAARKALGVVKRQIRMIGRAATC